MEDSLKPRLQWVQVPKGHERFLGHALGTTATEAEPLNEASKSLILCNPSLSVSVISARDCKCF